MMDDIQDQLKQLEKDRARLQKKQEELEARLKAQQEADKKLEKVFATSGFSSPKALIEALSLKYGVKPSAVAKNGRPRKRTKVTADLRDRIKSEIEEGRSKNSVSKTYEISYAVVSKIVDGAYDHL